MILETTKRPTAVSRMIRRVCLLVLALAVSATAAAVPAGNAGTSGRAESGPGVLPPRLEARYQQLTSELRCPVCQNEPIATSQAQIAGALREIVRKKLLAGESNSQIKQYMISRYGLFAVYKPPLEGGTFLLWFGPFILLLIGLGVLALAIRRRRHSLAESEDENA